MKFSILALNFYKYTPIAGTRKVEYTDGMKIKKFLAAGLLGAIIFGAAVANSALPFTFANLSGNVPAANLDANFVAVDAMGITQCTAVGTNTIGLTQNANQAVVSTYANYQQFSFVAVNNSTGLVTVNINSISALPLYSAGGTTQAGSGSIVLGGFYVIAYNSALDSGLGGFVIVNATPSTTNGTVTSVTFTGDGTVLSSVPSSAVTTSGTLTASIATQTAHTVLAGPTSSTAAPTFRALVNGDFPTSGVSAGSYTAANITVNAQGIITTAASGGGGGVAGRLLNVQAITSSGTYTKTTGTNSQIVECWGAGGGGGSGSPGTGGATTFDILTANGGIPSGSSPSSAQIGGTASGGNIMNSTGGSSETGNSQFSGFAGAAAGGGGGAGASGGTGLAGAIPGGGGGEDGAGTSNRNGSGAGYVKHYYSSSVTGITVTIGAGGTAGTSGYAGGRGQCNVYEYS